MPRPPKCRKVCSFPKTPEFLPAQDAGKLPPIILTIDEYEALRLIDREGLSQEQCCQRMEIARTTVQKIYESARKKLADFLVDGRPLRIEGGSYRLCGGGDPTCGEALCHNHPTKGEHTMRIAVTYENGEIFQHFGHTEFFKLYDVEDGKIVATQVISTNGSGHGALAGVLRACGAEVLICGGIGGGAQMALAEAGIRLYGGVSGKADAAAEALVAGKLTFDPDVHCDHHSHGEGHSCGDHGCGSHHCGG